MVSIVLESLLVFAVVMMFTSDKVTNKIAAAQIASIGWRVGYVVYMVFVMVTTGFIADPLLSFANGFVFVLFSGVLGGLLASALIYFDQSLKYKFNFKFDTKPVYATGLVILATIATFIL